MNERKHHSRIVAACFALLMVGVFTTSSAWAHSPARQADSSATEELTVVDALVLGVVEGVTEYLPVSSTGHLIITEKLLGLGETDAAKKALDSYTVIIQVGAIVAVLALYWRRIVELIQGLLGRSADGRRLLINILIAFAPAVVLGLAFGDTIDKHLLEPTPVAIAWIVGGVVIIALVGKLRAGRTSGAALETLTPRKAVIIGVVQCLALWPGVSRSLVTIIAGVLLAGLTLSAAVEFSFLLGLLTLTGATALVALKDGSGVIDQYGIVTPLIGIIAALVSAVVAVRSFVAYLNRKDLTGFGWYRLAIGAAVLIAVATTSW
jgi:undecaprenyl-diphosphatase